MSLPTKSRRHFWRWAALFVILLLGGIALLLTAMLSSSQGLNRMKKLVRTRFPDVHQLSTDQLASMLKDTSNQPVLLDIREKVEFETSHLPGAIQVDPDMEVSKLEEMTSTNRLFVVYCSVGYRSSELATRMLDAGITNVVNLEGSIFQWANEGRVLESKGQPTQLVHPYNQTFGRLLRAEHRAAVPNIGKE